MFLISTTNPTLCATGSCASGLDCRYVAIYTIYWDHDCTNHGLWDY